ncbi:hypothetical protein DENSPDRAFT_166969 [Dentipellis sp. KUC8613]|nr:hypothetical protein DENSPDRAFT_166969 [Dentipellis sp. KUC8613]
MPQTDLGGLAYFPKTKAPPRKPKDGAKSTTNPPASSASSQSSASPSASPHASTTALIGGAQLKKTLGGGSKLLPSIFKRTKRPYGDASAAASESTLASVDTTDASSVFNAPVVSAAGDPPGLAQPLVTISEAEQPDAAEGSAGNKE